MAIPTQQELYDPVLEFLSDGEVHTSEQLQKFVRRRFHLTAAQRAKKLDSGAPAWTNRIAWTIRNLKEDGMLVAPQRAHYQITEAGKKYLSERNLTLETISKSKSESDKGGDPFEQFEQLYNDLKENFFKDTLSTILDMPPTAFKELIDRLLRMLDYDDDEIFDAVLKFDENGNIIGSLVMRNERGFDVRHLEAKRLSYDEVIDENEVRRFVEAMVERSQIKKGLFLATATFSDEAREYADEHSVHLIDVEDVVNLIISHNLGVTTRTYKLKYIEKEFFTS